MEVGILIILILLNAFFSASEIALISLNDNKVRLMAEAGDKKAQQLQKLLSEPSRFLATIQIGITLAGFMASAFAAGSFSKYLTAFLLKLGIPLAPSLLDTLSVVIITLLLSYFTLVLGELVPKRLAMQKAEPISMFAVVPLTVLSKLSAPFVKLLTLSTNVIIRLFGVDPNADEEEVTEEEIRMMIDVGEERGAIQSLEKMMINNIFEFDNKTVSELMTHRTDIVGIPLEASLDAIFAIINTEKYTRFPVYEDSLDQIVGILHVKDVIPHLRGSSDSFRIQDILRTPCFLPASKSTDEAFRSLQKNKVHIAIVIDEYGGTYGIITIEDLIEEIVGNIFDEHDEPEEWQEIRMLGEGVFLMNGLASLHDVEDALELDLPTQDYDTLSGFLIGQLGRIPHPGETAVILYAGLQFQVEQVENRRITRVRVQQEEQTKHPEV
ncbi:hemolysin family protein [Ectobacillus ponti]|uniref:Hemolysin family protein n=1 Tax=Ectobacillus ponti TaxID=2961894 RepID=A0AA41X1I7_9BACI|nr:hemolysin family protein [Ectobacillus ponti]MCP8967236.1 hemolysin family protein [Ectobacillus ponti]